MQIRIIVILLLIIAALIRIDFLQAIDARLDSDEAIVGLMAKHILEGKGIPTFYYGQHYMGSFEALVVAVGFAFFGISSWVVQSVPLIFSIIFLYLLYLLAYEVAGKRAAIFSLLLGALAPATLIIWSTKARGGFIEIMCIGTAALLAAVYWLKKPDKRNNLTILTGLLLGFGWWVNNQIIYYMLPVALMGLLVWFSERIRFKQVLRYLFNGVISFFVGGAPYWIYNIERDFPSLGMFRLASLEDILKHLLGVFDTAIPILLGAKRFWHTEELFVGSTSIVWLLLLACLATYLFTRMSDLKSLLKGKIDYKFPLEIIIIFIFATFLIFCISTFGYLVQAPRYLLPAYTGLLILFGYVIDQQYQRKNYMLASFILFLFLGLNWSSSFLGGRAVPGEPYVFKQQRASTNHGELISWLAANNYNWVRTNYWIGYRLAFETKEKIRFLVFAEPHETRIKEYQKIGLTHNPEQMPLVLVPAQAEYVEKALKAQGYNFEKEFLSDYIVIHKIRPQVDNLQEITAGDFVVSVSDKPEFASMAIDDNLDSRWASARPQSNDMYFEIKFNTPRAVRGLKYDTGAWPHDYPRGLEIQLTFSNGSVENLYAGNDYDAIRYYLHGATSLMFYMNKSNVSKIKLLQTGSHELFDWSVAELSIYE